MDPERHATEPLRVLLVDDEPQPRQALKALLATYPEVEVVGEAADGVQAVEMTAACHPDVVIMDVFMPRMDGIEATRHIKRLPFEVGVLLITLYGAMEDTAKAAGADAFLLKVDSGDEIMDAICCQAAPFDKRIERYPLWDAVAVW